MRTAFKFLFLIFISPSLYASNLNQGAIFIGGIVGVTAAGYGGGIPTEMLGWSDANTKTTAQFGADCDVNYEMRLYTNNAYNFLIIGLKNESKDDVRVNSSSSKYKFSDGQMRLGQLRYINTEPEYPSGGVGLIGMIFPSKEDFANVDTLEVTVPMEVKNAKKACFMTAVFRRNPKADQLLDETKSVSTVEIAFGYGPVISRSSYLRELSDSGNGFTLSFNGYFDLNSGFWLKIVGEDYDDSNISKLNSWSPSISSRDLSNIAWGLGYGYRTDSAKDLYFTYDIGVAASNMYYKISGSVEGDSNGLGLTFLHDLSVNYRWARVRIGPGRGDYIVGASLTHYHVFENKVDNVNVGGDSLSARAFIKFGY